jgi:hypothetical protein
MADKLTTFMCPDLLEHYGSVQACKGIPLPLISLILVFYVDVQYTNSVVGEFVTLGEVDQMSRLNRLYL